MRDARKLFNLRAPAWDRKKPSDDDAIELMLTLAALRPGMRILDAGCGTGVLTPWLLEHRPSEVVGVDYAGEMIAIAKSKNRDPRVRYLCVNFYDLLPSASFDCCIFYNVFPHFPDPHRLMEHTGGLLRPGGRLVISHAPGRKRGLARPSLPAQGLINLLKKRYRIDILADNDALFLVVATLLETPPEKI